ncbi:hypothetical protein ACFL9U_14145, partial [Thermodesulfobacteriota bacterium]
YTEINRNCRTDREAKMAHVPAHTDDSKSSILTSRPGYKPVLLLIAAVVFTVIVLLPPPQSMIDLAAMVNPPGYALSKGSKTITENINKKLRPNAFEAEKKSANNHAQKHENLLTPAEAAQMAKVMLGIFFVAVFLWGTEALPIGATNILVGVMLYLFSILPISEISQAYMFVQ